MDESNGPDSGRSTGLGVLSKATGASVARARVTRTDGTREVHYSLPKLSPWDLKGRLWLRRRLRVMREEDREWLQSPSE